MHDIFDIACNFTSERFDNDLNEVIDRAIKNNVTKFGLICSRVTVSYTHLRAHET